MKIAIVTACQSGIANSIIAAGLLDKATAELGWEAAIECQSSVVDGKTLTVDEINQADCIVVATSKTLDLQRFVGKKFTLLILQTVLKIRRRF